MTKKDSKIYSMTGFASSEHEMGPIQLRFECKSLNHRFSEVKVRLPKDFSKIEPFLRSELQKSFARGSIEFKIEILGIQDLENQEASVDTDLAKYYFHSLEKLQTELGTKDTPNLSHLLEFSDIFKKPGSDTKLQKPEELWATLKPAIGENISLLKKMRLEEGQKLVEQFDETILTLKEKAKTLKKLREKYEGSIEEKIQKKITDIFQKYSLSEKLSQEEVLNTRIAQELALVLDRSDIKEELTRLDHHLDQLETTIKNGGTIGRKIEFILQETNREINTLGNKTQEVQISDEVVQMKVMTEQLKEQCMNLE